MTARKRAGRTKVAAGRRKGLLTEALQRLNDAETAHATARVPAGAPARAPRSTGVDLAPETKAEKPRKAKPSTRKDRKGLVLYLDPADNVTLRRLALDTNLSVQQLGLKALAMLFAEYKQPPIRTVAPPPR